MSYGDMLRLLLLGDAVVCYLGIAVKFVTLLLTPARLPHRSLVCNTHETVTGVLLQGEEESLTR